MMKLKTYDLFFGDGASTAVVVTNEQEIFAEDPSGLRWRGCDVISPAPRFVRNTSRVMVMINADRLRRSPPAPTVSKDITQFVANVFRYSRANKPRKASDLVFEFFDSKFEEGDFDECKQVLDGMRRISDLPDTVLVAMLAVTHSARPQLSPSRGLFLDRVCDVISNVKTREEADFIKKTYR